MLNSMDYIRLSLELHLFFARIMKEHSFFLEIGFTPKDDNYSHTADFYRKEFDRLLGDATVLSNGNISPEVLRSGEVITPYTLQAEMASSYFTGINIPTALTRAEAGLATGPVNPANPRLEQAVKAINQRAIGLLGGLIQFKATVLSNVLACKMFTVNYPLLIDHIMREAKFYLTLIGRLESRENINIERDAAEQELFWNRIMAEHSKFIRGLLDPTENDLIMKANNFGNEFDQLTAEALKAMDKTIPQAKVTADSLKATVQIRDFKEAGTKGLVECKIKSIIIPLLGDHTLREASHFLRLLKMFSI